MNDNRKDRRKADAVARVDTAAFLKIANAFIDLANQKNETVKATDLHMAMIYATARYNAYVANIVLDVPDHEDFVAEMVKEYTAMLRQHLADPNLKRPA
jgi:translation elongation factor EF-4